MILIINKGIIPMMGMPFLHGLEAPIGRAFGDAVSWLAQNDVMALVQHVAG